MLADNARGCMIAGPRDLRPGKDRVLAVLPCSSPFAQSFCVIVSLLLASLLATALRLMCSWRLWKFLQKGPVLTVVLCGNV